MQELMKENHEKGFTLVELLVAMVIAAIVMTSVYSVYAAQQRSYIVQEQVAAMHQNLRSAMYFMEREIRMAGCDPTGAAGAGIQSDSNATSIHFTEDFRGKDAGDPPDGDTGDPDEDISYFLADADGDGQVDDLVRDTGGVEANIEKVIAENIARLKFTYLESDSITETAVTDDMRFVQIELDATNDDGSKTDTLQTRIHARNLGM
jgi:type IV pilus assembly protein PilW